MAITHLPLALLRQVGSILEALGVKANSYAAQVTFANTLGWYQAGIIQRAGSIHRFEAGYRDSRENSPSASPYPRGSGLSRSYRLVLKAEAQGLLEGDLEQPQVFHRTAEAAATAPTPAAGTEG
jgi:hypothetical protein